MSALTRFFFSPVYAPKSMWSVVNWWESRRALYNLMVGAAGSVTVVTVTLLSWIHPHPLPFRVPLGPILLYAFMANLFNSMGPVIDVFIHRTWGPGYAPVGPAMFRYGFAFSVGLTLLPIPLAVMAWVARLFFAGM